MLLRDAIDLQPIADLLQQVQESSTAVGRIPPVPNTWRGRFGRCLVLIVRRMLFWYTPQITLYQAGMHRIALEQFKVLAQLAAALERHAAQSAQLHRRLDTLAEEFSRERLDSLQTRLAKAEDAIETQKRAAESMIWDAQDALAAAHDKLGSDLEDVIRDLQRLKAEFEDTGLSLRRSRVS